MGGYTNLDQPCAACRMLHRKCTSDCVLAPHFPVHEPEKFASVHKVFGASNVIKILQAVDESDREDAVKSLVYEARTRLRDPVYGSAGVIFYLQVYVKELELELEVTRLQLQESQDQRDKLLDFLLNATHRPSPVDELHWQLGHLPEKAKKRRLLRVPSLTSRIIPV